MPRHIDDRIHANTIVNRTDFAIIVFGDVQDPSACGTVERPIDGATGDGLYWSSHSGIRID